MKNKDLKQMVMWAAVGIAVVVGLVITGKTVVLWAFIIPALIDY